MYNLVMKWVFDELDIYKAVNYYKYKNDRNIYKMVAYHNIMALVV